MDEWLEDLDKCKDMGWYFEIESEESGRLADDIRKVLARIEQLEVALRNIYDKWENGVGICDVIDAMDAARTALGEMIDGN